MSILKTVLIAVLLSAKMGYAGSENSGQYTLIDGFIAVPHEVLYDALDVAGLSACRLSPSTMSVELFDVTEEKCSTWPDCYAAELTVPYYVYRDNGDVGIAAMKFLVKGNSIPSVKEAEVVGYVSASSCTHERFGGYGIGVGVSR